MLAKRIIPVSTSTPAAWSKASISSNLRMPAIPSRVARRYDEQGADESLPSTSPPAPTTATSSCTWSSKVAEQVFIPLTVGGGVRTVDDVRRLLNAGADKVSINTAAVNNPQVVADAALQGRAASASSVAIDAKRVAPGKWEVFTHGGRNRTGLDAVDPWAQKVAGSLGAGEILLTSMDRDGTRTASTWASPAPCPDAISIPVIARGGGVAVSTPADGVTPGRADAVLAASIFHFGDHTVREAKELMRARGIEVRL